MIYDAKSSDWKKVYKDIIIQIQSFQIINTPTGRKYVYLFSDGIHSYPGLVLIEQLQRQHSARIAERHLLSVDLKIYEVISGDVHTIAFLAVAINAMEVCTRAIGQGLIALSAKYFLDEFKKASVLFVFVYFFIE